MMSTTIGYRTGWLIDGTGHPADRDRIITIRADRFGPILNGTEPRPLGTPIVDLSDCTVLPALIDSHVHLVMSGTVDPFRRQGQLNLDYANGRKTIREHLRRHLVCGVLAVRDGGDHHGHTLRYRCDSDTVGPPRPPVTIASAGRARHAPGRYGKLIGIAVGPGMTLTQSAFRTGSRRNHLKLVNSGLNSLTRFGVTSPPQFESDALRAVVEIAQARHQAVMIHANGVLPVQQSIKAGCTSIEHGFFMGRENMRRMADRGVVWVPTAVTMKAYHDNLAAQAHPHDPASARVAWRNLEHQLEQIGMARQLGVTIALGTDAGSPGVHHGVSVKEELGLLVTAGISVEGAVRCASRNGALLMGLSDRGEITPGMRADFIAVQAAPEQLPSALHRIVLRVAQGRVITDETLF